MAHFVGRAMPPTPPSTPPLVILGCGYAGTAIARMALATGSHVTGIVRTEGAARALRAVGVTAHASATLTNSAVDAWVTEGARVVVAFPPDGTTDAIVAPVLRRAAAVVYISSTGVYGAARGRVDEDTPVDDATPEASTRLAAEAMYRKVGAITLRAAGIYGPWRGLHRRLLQGTLRMPADPGQVVSRVHVDDLATVCLAALDRASRGATYCVADDAPVAQAEVIAWLCALLGLPLPPPAQQGARQPGQRTGRTVVNAQVKATLGLTLRYPTWRDGYGMCLAVEAPVDPQRDP